MDLYEIARRVSEQYRVNYVTDGKRLYVKQKNGIRKEIKPEVVEKVFGARLK